ncbi:hypothetical protein CBL_11334 [Carabus blaptoides fortunei]
MTDKHDIVLSGWYCLGLPCAAVESYGAKDKLINIMESKADVKAEIIDISGNGATGTMLREVSSFPDWIGQFTEDCTKVCCTRCSEQLDELMEKFIVHIKTEVPLCATSPNRSALISNRMFKKMYFFYTYYVDIKEVYVMSLWNEHMSKLMPLYCQFEMKSANRLHRGKETDGMICMRIMNALWVYFAGNKEHIIHVLLRVQNYSRKYKDIFDPIFRKMLVTNKPNRTYTDLEYIRNLLAFKLWKRLYFRHDKKAISDLALTELVPPQSFIMNYRKYKFLPCYANKSDVNNFLVTVLFDLDAAIREYFAYIDNKKIRSFDTDFHHNEKKSFISDFCASFSSHDNNMDELTNHVHDNFTLDDVKQETETIRIDEDDDLIIIDPDPEPVAPRAQPTAFTSSGTLDVIDLTADEPDMPSASSAETPSWCQDLIKLSKERVVEPPPSPTVVEEPPTREESQETEEILRENLCNTPLDIMEDSNMSEANSVGLTEITSTSQTVQDSVLDSNTPNEFQPTESQFVEKLTISEVREVHQESDEFEHVDSTSNFNDEECEPDVEAPTVKTYVVESTVQQTQEGLVCSEVISEIIADQADIVNEVDQQQQQPVSAVSNSVFEQFMSAQVVTETDQNEPVVSESVIQEAEVNVSDYTPSLRDSLDSDDIPDEDDSCQTNRLELEQDSEPSPEPVLQDKDGDEEVYSQTETDELTSPMMEPISGNDFANYLSSLNNSESYDDLQKDFITNAGELTVNRKRKNGERVVRTYNSVKARTPKVDIPEMEPRKSVISDKTTERRVPLNGEKVVRFADDLWEPVYTKSFKLSKREMACFTPEVRVRKRRYCDELMEEDEREKAGQGTANDIREYIQPPIVFEPQYTHLLPAYNAKTILERQDYVKDEKQQRAIVQKRPHFAANNNFVDPSTSYEQKLPDVVQTKKRGAKQQVTTEVTKKRKQGRQKSTRSLADSTPHPTNSPVEQSPQINPWRFSIT